MNRALNAHDSKVQSSNDLVFEMRKGAQWLFHCDTFFAMVGCAVAGIDVLMIGIARGALKNTLVIAFTSLIVGCSTVQHGGSGGWVGFTETGQASYYADKFQNRTTASGATYKHELHTAAHKKLPFGSMVKVTNIKNGKSVVVKINDRGPFVKGRVIDLSKSAFSTIGSTSVGLINVKIEVQK